MQQSGASASLRQSVTTKRQCGRFQVDGNHAEKYTHMAWIRILCTREGPRSVRMLFGICAPFRLEITHQRD